MGRLRLRRRKQLGTRVLRVGPTAGDLGFGGAGVDHDLGCFAAGIGHQLLGLPGPGRRDLVALGPRRQRDAIRLRHRGRDDGRGLVARRAHDLLGLGPCRDEHGRGDVGREPVGFRRRGCQQELRLGLRLRQLRADLRRGPRRAAAHRSVEAGSRVLLTA